MMRQHDCYANHDHATQFDASCCDHQEIERLQLECELMYGASQRAVAEWCEQDPKGRALVLPDLKEHIVWAFTELASARADLGRAVEALKELVHELGEEVARRQSVLATLAHWRSTYGGLASGRTAQESNAAEIAFNAACERLYEAGDAEAAAGSGV